MQLLNVLLLSGTGIKIAQLFAALSLLILLHEFGHFFFARLFKTRVEKFYLFFDFMFPFPNVLPFSLFKKKVGDTEYGIGWFPLGGYVKISGMVDESMDKEAMALPPQPWEFRSKPAWQRLFIMLGGIIVNVVLAMLIYSLVMFVYGEKRLPVSAMKDGIVVTDSMGYKLGFRDGDQVLEVNGKAMHYYDEIMPELLYAKNVTVNRNGAVQKFDLPVNFIEKLIDNKSKSVFSFPIPTVIGKVTKGSNAELAKLQTNDQITGINGTETKYFDQFKSKLDSLKGQNVVLSITRDGKAITVPAKVSDTGTLGFMQADLDAKTLERMGIYHFDTKHYGFFEAFPAGIAYSWEKLSFYAKQFKLILNPKTGAYKGIGGFGTMTQIFPDYWDWETFWKITAFISLVLAFMNLLPIPGLDGGYVFFLLFEMITRRKVSDKVMEKATGVGLVLLLALMIYANGMDVFRAWFQK